MKNRIIYILGAGRSGTTLLDIILGNGDDIFSAGELNRFTKRNGIPHDARDEKVSYFWNEIVTRLAKEGYSEPRSHYELSKKFEYHSSFHRFVLPYKKEEFKKYADYQVSLFNAIYETAMTEQNKNIIVDSAKYPLRAFNLSKIFKENISFIYIQRNPRVVVESFQKKDIEQPSKTRFGANAYLLIVNTLAMQVLKRLRRNHKVSIVSFDRLLSDPVSELAKIEQDLSLDLSVPKNLINQQLPLKVGYLFDGNRLRTNEEVVIRKATPSSNAGKGIDKVFYPLHKLTWYNK